MISMRKKCSSTVVGLVLLRLSITCGLQNSKLNGTKRFSLPSIKCSAAPPRLRLLRLLPSARKWNRWAQFRQWNIAEELGTMSKNNFWGITLVRRPVWRIGSLTLIISCHKVTSQWESVCQYAEEAGQPSRDNVFYQSDSSLNMLMADPENLPNARVVAVIFGFPSFVFNELSRNPFQWFDVEMFFLEESSNTSVKETKASFNSFVVWDTCV